MGFKPICLSKLVALVQLKLAGVLVYTDIRLEKYAFRCAESSAKRSLQPYVGSPSAACRRELLQHKACKVSI